jgi:adenylylsulfate kinase
MENIKNITSQAYQISKKDRRINKGHNSFVIWMTGLSGSGKSTLANALDRFLFERKLHSYVLDGDNIRLGLNNNLGFSPEDRKENIRRVGEVSKLFVDAGTIVTAAFISPYLQDRKGVRELFEVDEFIEVYVKCPLEQCEIRDPKGLYIKARQGKIKDFTGISSPYEESNDPEIIIETDKVSVDDGIKSIIRYLKERRMI